MRPSKNVSGSEPRAIPLFFFSSHNCKTPATLVQYTMIYVCSENPSKFGIGSVVPLHLCKSFSHDSLSFLSPLFLPGQAARSTH